MVLITRITPAALGIWECRTDEMQERVKTCAVIVACPVENNARCCINNRSEVHLDRVCPRI